MEAANHNQRKRAGKGRLGGGEQNGKGGAGDWRERERRDGASEGERRSEEEGEDHPVAPLLIELSAQLITEAEEERADSRRRQVGPFCPSAVQPWDAPGRPRLNVQAEPLRRLPLARGGARTAQRSAETLKTKESTCVCVCV